MADKEEKLSFEEWRRDTRNYPTLLCEACRVARIQKYESYLLSHCEECGGLGHTIGFEGQKKIRFDCESCSGRR
jgi:hypothetical protein